MNVHFVALVGLVTLLPLAACGREGGVSPRAAATTEDQAERIAALEAENRELRRRAGELPASLDRCYPPESERPVWLLSMLGLGESMDALVADLLEGDPDGARAAYADFAERYATLRALVPEWSVDFPDAPVDALGDAMAAGDPVRVMPALGRVGEVCSACHADRMGPAQQRYHWGSFATLSVEGPVRGTDVPFPLFKHGLAAQMTAVGRDVSQGQVEAAREQMKRLRASFDALADTCGACHTSPRAYYVDVRVQRLLERMTEEVARPTPDVAVVAELTRSLGQQSCQPCHRVHVPAAFAGAVRAPR